jgi:hypothetical protein
MNKKNPDGGLLRLYDPAAEIVQKHLDSLIAFWRDKFKNADEAWNKSIEYGLQTKNIKEYNEKLDQRMQALRERSLAECYVDCLQSIRYNLIGETLP